MRELYSSEIEKLLDSQSEFSTKDFFEVMKECPAPTVYSRIRALVTKGILTQIGKGKYAKGSAGAQEFGAFCYKSNLCDFRCLSSCFLPYARPFKRF